MLIMSQFGPVIGSFLCRTIDRLEAKELVMGLVNHGNSEVRMQALLAIQKMMVQNW